MKLSLLVPLLLLATGCTRPESAAPAASLPSVRVRLVAVQAEELPQFTEVTGTVRPVRRAILAANVMGAITDLPVNLGQRVKAGELLLKIFAGEAAARLAQARAVFNATRRDLERERTLQVTGAGTADSVRTLEDRLTGLEASVREAEAQLGYTEIHSPFDGVIARRLVYAGDLAVPGQPLLEVEGTDDFEIEAGIPESLASALAPGAVLGCEAAGVRFAGTLKEISSTADAATRSVGAKIAVPAGAPIRSGQFTRIQVPGPSIRALLVPVSAVSVNGQMERVFVADDGGRAVLRLVKTGAMRGDRLEILSGLAPSDRVVIAPPAGLREGQPLEAQP